MLAYNEKPEASWTPVKLLWAANLTLATLALFSWPLVASYIAEPVGTAAEAALDSSERPNLWNYPYVLIWACPLLGAWLSYMLQKARMAEAARFFGALPITLIISCALWYWLFQLTNHGDAFYRVMSNILVTDGRSMLVWLGATSGLLIAFLCSIAGMRDTAKYFMAIPLFGLPGYYAWVLLFENTNAWLPQVLSFG